jgi:hypothetical protein
MMWAGHAAYIWELRNALKLKVEKSEVKMGEHRS